MESNPKVQYLIYRQIKCFVTLMIKSYFFLLKFPDSERCETCDAVIERLETIDDDTDKHNIQFVKTNDVKLAHEIGVFSFPALIYYETGVPIMFDGKHKIILKIISYEFELNKNLSIICR